MASKRHFDRGREDAHAAGVGRIIRRQHEGRLGEVELAGDGLHFRRREAGRVGDHGERIAAEHPVGEDVDGVEPDGSHAESFRRSKSLTCCGLALPPVVFITWPTNQPMTFS